VRACRVRPFRRCAIRDTHLPLFVRAGVTNARVRATVIGWPYASERSKRTNERASERASERTADQPANEPTDQRALLLRGGTVQFARAVA